MTRYVAGVVAEIRYATRAAGVVVPPDPDPIDWMLDPATPYEPTGDGDAATLSTTVVGRRPMAIYAKTEAEARSLAVASAARWRDDVFYDAAAGPWRVEDVEIRIESLRKDSGAARPRHRFEVDFARLVAPDVASPMPLDQMFETLRWMLATGRHYADPNRASVAALLSGSPGSTIEGQVATIRSMDDLRDRLVRGVLGQAHAVYREWREDMGISPTATLSIETLHYGDAELSALAHRPGHAFGADPIHSFGSMLQHSREVLLSRSLNPSHPAARTIQGVEVLVLPGSYAFALRYGYADGSSWRHDLALTRGNEPFLETLERAVARFAVLVPDFDAQIEGLRRIPTTRVRHAA